MIVETLASEPHVLAQAGNGSPDVDADDAGPSQAQIDDDKDLVAVIGPGGKLEFVQEPAGNDDVAVVTALLEPQVVIPVEGVTPVPENSVVVLPEVVSEQDVPLATIKSVPSKDADPEVKSGASGAIQETDVDRNDASGDVDVAINPASSPRRQSVDVFAAAAAAISAQQSVDDSRASPSTCEDAYP